MRRHHSLRSRLFSWFFGAIILAMVTSALVVATARPEPITGAEALAHNVAVRLAMAWDDPEGTRAFVGEVRDVTGFDVRLVREPRSLPQAVHRTAQRGGAIAPDGPEHVFIPVVRDGRLLGALEMERFGPRLLHTFPWAWWRFALALLLGVSALSTMAGGVANQLARPLERLAQAADRLGSGELAFRADVGGEGGRGRRRWVADEVRAVGVSFNRMADRIEAMVRGQRELLGAISHELRSPLGRARVALEIARDRLPMAGEPPAARAAESAVSAAPGDTGANDPLSGPVSGGRTAGAALDDLEKQLGAVDVILGDLLDVARAGLVDVRKEPCDLVAWLRARVADQPSSPVIQVVTPEAGAPLVVAFDPSLLARAVENLIINARAHGHPPDQPLEVRVAPQGERVRVSVRDRGPGFPAGFAERAFEPFVRAEPSRARPVVGSGSGLGLAIVRRIVEAHGGSVFARNVPAGTGAFGGADGAEASGAEVGFDLPASPVIR